MRQEKTRFEHIPVETVKKIAKKFPEDNDQTADSASGVESQEPTCSKEPWRELANKIQHEQNPNRMIELVEQLIATLNTALPRTARYK